MINIWLFLNNFLCDIMQLFCLLHQLLCEDREHLVFGQSGLTVLHPAQQVLIGHHKASEASHGILKQLGNHVRVGHKVGIPVGQLFNLISQHLGIFITNNLHESRGNISQVIKGDLLAQNIIMNFLMFSDPSLDLVFFSWDSFHFFNLLLSFVQPLF